MNAPFRPQMVILLVSALIVTALATTGCAGARPGSESIGVVVSLLPQAEFVEAVGGQKVEVSVMVPPGATPHTYEPAPSQMAAMARADMYVAMGSGVEFEISWLDKLLETNPGIHLVDCSEGIDLIETREHEHEEADAHPQETPTDGTHLDPHVWMSLPNAGVIVSNICNALEQLDPENGQYYRQNRDDYLAELAKLHDQFTQGFSGLANRVFMIHHPSMGYFARDYGLTQLAVEIEGKESTPAGLAELVKEAEEHDVRVVFVSPQYNPANAEVIAREIGAEVIYLDVLARDYVQNMRNIYDLMLPAMCPA